jgi:hypothetical protein
MMEEEVKLETVYIARGQFEAEIIRGRLEVEGVPSLLKYESAGKIFGVGVDGLAEVQIQVPATMAEFARKVLNVGLDASLDQSPDISN